MKNATRKRSSKSLESPYRACDSYTWEPSRQLQVMLKRGRVRFRNPAQFIRDVCLRVVPEWQVQMVKVIYLSTRDKQAVWFDFGEVDGVQTQADAYVSGPEALAMAGYLRALAGPVYMEMSSIAASIPPENDGGVELDLPTVTEAELAAMNTTTEAVQ